jgi:phage terminase large subunit GpA-like protein
MRCPTCEKEFYPQPENLLTYWADKDSYSDMVVQFKIQQCPACNEIIIIRERGTGFSIGDKLHLNNVIEESVVYPQVTEMVIPPEVPEEYRTDLLEAHAALQYSTKASAALSRRLLQKTLREKLGIKK